MAAVGFLSRNLSGPLPYVPPYVPRHITVKYMFNVHTRHVGRIYLDVSNFIKINTRGYYFIFTQVFLLVRTQVNNLHVVLINEIPI